MLALAGLRLANMTAIQPDSQLDDAKTRIFPKGAGGRGPELPSMTSIVPRPRTVCSTISWIRSISGPRPTKRALWSHPWATSASSSSSASEQEKIFAAVEAAVGEPLSG